MQPSLAYARIEGKAAINAHFQNSSLMNEDKRYQPIIFHSEGPNVSDQVSQLFMCRVKICIQHKFNSMNWNHAYFMSLLSECLFFLGIWSFQEPFPVGVNVRTRPGKSRTNNSGSHQGSPSNSGNGDDCTNGIESSIYSLEKDGE